MSTQQTQAFECREQEEGIHLRNYWLVLKRRRWLIFLAFGIVVASAAIYAIGTPKQYQATAVVRVPTSGRIGLPVSIGVYLPIASAGDIATEIEIIKGRNTTEKAARNLGLDKKRENLGLDWRQIVLGFQGRLKVKQRSGTNLIEIVATGQSPQEARDMANATADAYIQLSEATSHKVWSDLMDLMEAKLHQAKEDLESSRQLLHDYEAKEGITTAFGPLLMGSGASTGGYGTQYAIPEAPQAVAELKAGIIEMEVQLEGLRKSFSDADPRIIALRNQIQASRQKLSQEEERAIEKYNKQFDLTRIAAEVVFDQQLYSSLVSKQEELKAQYIMQNKPPEIIERAQVPLYPSGRGRKLTLMGGGALGLLLGVGVALLREFLDNSIHTAQDITALLQLPVLGMIPYAKKVKRDPLRGVLTAYHNANPISGVRNASSRAREAYAESYRMLALQTMAAIDGKAISGDSSVASLLQNDNATFSGQQSASEIKGGIALVVTSSVPEEGKSMVAANLAISIAQTGRKVLLVDADYRSFRNQHLLLRLTNGKPDESGNYRKRNGRRMPRPRKMQEHRDDQNPESSIGFMDVLAQDASWDDVIKRTPINNLYAIAAGGRSLQLDPSALLTSSHLEDFIKLSREQFDFVIFDSRPATLASGSAAIGSKADGVVLIVKASHARKDVILQAKQKLNIGRNILGAVLNCAIS